MISYNAKVSDGQERLTTFTSIESYKDLSDKNTQLAYIERLLRLHPEGLSDFQIRKELNKKSIFIPLSTVSARRNDINKKYVERGVGQVVINVNRETRLNPTTNKSCLVWKWRF